MTSKIVKSPNIENIKSFGKELFYNKPNQKIKEEYHKKETNRKEKLEKYLKISSEATTLDGWLNSRIKLALLNKDIETEFILKLCKEMHQKFQEIEIIRLEGWKNKSGLKLLETPDTFICITYRKEEKGGEVKETKTEINKKEVNELIAILRTFEEKENIPTPRIAERLYKKDWIFIFSDRPIHIKFTYMLNILEQKGYIKYFRSGKVTLLKNLENTKW